jgi:hypothetical protein
MEELDLDNLEAITPPHPETSALASTLDNTLQEIDLDASQFQFEKCIELLDAAASEWVVPIALEGDLDLSFIENKGFPCLQKIVFQIPGEITALHNIPKQIVVLYCTRQKLQSTHTFFVDPKQSLLEELYLEQNMLTDISSLAALPHLALLFLDSNPLASIQVLPASLEELYVSRASLETMQLVDSSHVLLKQLYVLHINFNAHVVVLHQLPDSVVDFQHESTEYSLLSTEDEGTTTTSKQQRQHKQEHDYNVVLDEYFQLLHQYQITLFPRQNAAAKKQNPPTCVHCGKQGGTYFARNQNRYIARCGNRAHPCTLRIELFAGHFTHADTLIEQYQEDIHQLQQEIIALRLQSVFHLVPENEVAEKSKQLIQQYGDSETILKKIVHKTNTVHNVEKQQKIRGEIIEIQKQIHEQERLLKDMLKNGSKQMTEIIQYQMQVLQPLQEQRRDLLYRKMYVEISDDENSSRLRQYPVEMFMDEFNTAEPPRVIHYTM